MLFSSSSLLSLPKSSRPSAGRNPASKVQPADKCTKQTARASSTTLTWKVRSSLGQESSSIFPGACPLRGGEGQRGEGIRKFPTCLGTWKDEKHVSAHVTWVWMCAHSTLLLSLGSSKKVGHWRRYCSQIVRTMSIQKPWRRPRFRVQTKGPRLVVVVTLERGDPSQTTGLFRGELGPAADSQIETTPG